MGREVGRGREGGGDGGERWGEAGREAAMEARGGKRQVGAEGCSIEGGDGRASESKC